MTGDVRCSAGLDRTPSDTGPGRTAQGQPIPQEQSSQPRRAWPATKATKDPSKALVAWCGRSNGGAHRRHRKHSHPNSLRTRQRWRQVQRSVGPLAVQAPQQSIRLRRTFRRRRPRLLLRGRTNSLFGTGFPSHFPKKHPSTIDKHKRQ